MESGHVPLSLDWPFITTIPPRQTFLTVTVLRRWLLLRRLATIASRVCMPTTRTGPGPRLPRPGRSAPGSGCPRPSPSPTGRWCWPPCPPARPGSRGGAGPDGAPGVSVSAWLAAGGQPAAGSRVSVDVGNAGTVMRFLPAVAALTSATVRFDGDERIRQRPVGPLLAALRDLGARIGDDGRGAGP